MYPKQDLNIGTGKLHMKDHMEKWGGLEGKSLRIFVVVVVTGFFYVRFLALIFFSFYRSSCSEVFRKECCSEDFLN